jgi:hypothetical protein
VGTSSVSPTGPCGSRSAGGDEVSWTLDGAGGETFVGLSVRPGSWCEVVEAVTIVAADGRLRLDHLRVDARGSGALTPLGDGLQPETTDAGRQPILDWTPDARSLVWVEPAGDTATLRVVGWSDGAGPADTVAARLHLDVPADAHVDGFQVDDAGWTLLLRRASGGDPIEVPVARGADGRLVLAGKVSGTG